MKSTDTLAGRLNAQLDALDINQVEASEEIGIDQSSISKVLRGAAVRDSAKLRKLAAFLDVDIDEAEKLAANQPGLSPRRPRVRAGGDIDSEDLARALRAGNRRLTAAEKCEIVNRRKSGERLADLADHFGVSEAAISYTMKHFTPEAGPPPSPSNIQVAVVDAAGDVIAQTSDANPGEAGKRLISYSLPVTFADESTGVALVFWTP
jgi:transcriptional regulator with XRE-family HTH domain